jgi:hypothetical protein
LEGRKRSKSVPEGGVVVLARRVVVLVGRVVVVLVFSRGTKEEEESEEKLSRKRKAESEKAQKVEKIRHKHKGKAKVTDEDDEETEAGIGEDNSEEEEETPTGRQPKRELKCHVCLKRTENTVGCQGKDGCDEMVAICVVCATVVTEVYCTKHASAE